MLTQGGQGGRPAPLAPRLYRVPTHFRLNLYGIEWKLPTFGPPWLSGSYHLRCFSRFRHHLARLAGPPPTSRHGTEQGERERGFRGLT
jgi:hypothetical protein